MPLTSGTSLGHYDVTSLLGEGGMGQVWQATDTQLNRQVALKILPDAFADDPDRLARFTREAQILASLNHLNIAAIHGIEEAEGTRALVLELVEGPTLADRIAKGPIPLDEALPIAKQIAEALEAAHEAGVIHRDLKPANIKVREDGTVKVLDFGLAKALEPDSSTATTLTMAGTEAGAILGTPAYMSPEQARGTPLDKRTDVWAFGCVLYELLVGRPAFGKHTRSDTLAAVLDRETDWQALARVAPNRIVELIRRCLRKDRARRLRDLGDAAIEIDDARGVTSGAEPFDGSTPRPPRQWLVTGLAVVATLTAGLALWSVMAPSLPEPRAVSRVSIPLPSVQELVQSERSYPLALSPDGEWLVYVAERSGDRQLFLRSISEFEARPIEGTEGARHPFFSPDGQWIGFFSDGQLRRVAVAGGRPLPICAAVPALGATWSSDGYIYFTQASEPGLYRVPGDGSAPEALVAGDSEMDRLDYMWLHALPDGRGLVSSVVDEVTGDRRLTVLSFATDQWSLLGTGRQAQYLDGGFLVYHAGNGEIQVVPYDLDRQEMVGTPASVLDGVFVGQDGGAAYFAASRSGSLVFVEGGFARALVRADRAGRATPLTLRGYRFPRTSPDGRYVAVTIDPRPSQVAVIDLGVGLELTVQ